MTEVEATILYIVIALILAFAYLLWLIEDNADVDEKRGKK